MKEEKNIVLNIILTVVTCGIYGLVWFVQLTDDAKEYSGDTEMQSGVLALVLTLITCGIYGFYWDYKMAKMLQDAQTKNNLPANDNTIMYVILHLVGLAIVNYCLMQNDLNSITKVKSSGSAN